MRSGTCLRNVWQCNNTSFWVYLSKTEIMLLNCVQIRTVNFVVIRVNLVSSFQSRLQHLQFFLQSNSEPQYIKILFYFYPLYCIFWGCCILLLIIPPCKQRPGNSQACKNKLYSGITFPSCRLSAIKFILIISKLIMVSLQLQNVVPLYRIFLHDYDSS